MKSINGNSKHERTLNKFKKYFNIDLQESSNKYYVWKNPDWNYWTGVALEDVTFFTSKNGTRIAKISLMNFDKELLIPSWKVIKPAVYYTPYYVIRVDDAFNLTPAEKETVKKLVKGEDDLFTPKEKTLSISKNDYQW